MYFYKSVTFALFQKNITFYTSIMKKYSLIIYTVFTYLIACQPVKDTKSDQVKNPYNNFSDWAIVGGDRGVTHYSNLDQINTSNVSQLEVAWTYRTGDTRDDSSKYWGGSTIQANPIIINGIIYCTTPTLQLVALNARDGQELWRFNAHQKEGEGGYNRGVVYWENGDDKRLFYTFKNQLLAVNAKDGKAIESFGEKGRAYMRHTSANGKEEGLPIQSPGAPVLYKDLVISGWMSFNKGTSGRLTAHDAKTGELKWTFLTIPRPGELGSDTWGDPHYHKYIAGANPWSNLSIDVENGLVFMATGQPKDDLYRPNNPGKHLFGNSVVALDAETGKHKWHYQVIHHEIWDLDLSCAPMLIDLEQDGKKIPGLVQFTKTGNTFLFNRLTGELLSEVEEREVPPSTLYGEETWPTQPFVISPEPFAKQFLTPDDVTNISEESRKYALDKLKNKDIGWFVPVSERGNIYYGIHGGAEWGGGAWDPELDYVFINSNDVAWHIQLKIYKPEEITGIHPGSSIYSKGRCIECHGAQRKGNGSIPALLNLKEKYTHKNEVIQIIQNGKGAMPGNPEYSKKELDMLASFLLELAPDDTPVEDESEEEKYGWGHHLPDYDVVAFERFLDQNGYPATRPPWGTLNAIDLKTGKIAWKVPLGEFEALRKKGVPPTGTENFGGPVVTKGGLVFIAATMDEKIRAFDKKTGKILWEAKLPAGGYTTPSTYMLDGKQYLLIPCGGGGKPATKSGDSFVAFMLPD